MAGIRDNLQCPIHLDLLENAKTLPCQHVVCAECIGLWFAKKGKLICPTCNTAHHLPAGGVSNLPTNFRINSLVEHFKEMGTGANKGARRKTSYSEIQTAGMQRSSEQTERADPNKTFIKKKSKAYQDVCDSSISLMIYVCNSSGYLISFGGFDSLNVSAYTPKGERIRMDKEITEEGISVSFVPKMCGVHRVEALLGKQHVKESPLAVVVHPEGKFLTLVRGPLKCPRDVAVIDSTLYVTDLKEAPYVCVDWVGRQVHQQLQVQGLKDLNPFGIVASDEKIFVTDTSNNCVNIYCNGKLVNIFGNQYMSEPIGIAIDKHKQIYVSNQGSNEILIFAPTLLPLKSIKCDVGKKSSSESRLSCLAINQAEDKLVVADPGTCCLKIVNIKQSKVMKTITTRVSQAPATPCGVAIDRDDNIYVTAVFQPSGQKVGKNVPRSRSKSRDHRGVHPKDFGGWAFGGHQEDEGSEGEDTEKNVPDVFKQKMGKYVTRSRSKSRGNRGVHPKDYGGWGFGVHQADEGSESDDTEEGIVLMYNADGFFLGRFGEGELLNPGGIFIVNAPSPFALVVDMEGSGHGSKGPAVKIFTI